MIPVGVAWGFPGSLAAMAALSDADFTAVSAGAPQVSYRTKQIAYGCVSECGPFV